MLLLVDNFKITEKAILISYHSFNAVDAEVNA